ncbi:DsbA family protein [Streptomyces sp. 6N223]|uniref:DsbA family protein n=1 Tax=Streptomyces sp. 6N223 TaxID=3457412 RepID=UPI003FD36DDF
MSQNNREGNNSARERMRQEREQQRAAERRLRIVKVLGTAVLVLGVAGVIGVVAANGNGDDGGDGDAQPITVGEASAPTLAVYEDFRCPACAQFETTMSDTINELTDEGKLKVEYHLVTLIDGNLGGSGSLNAANAAVCARDAGEFTAYHDVLYANQPAESDDAFADKDHLIQLAGKVEGLDDKTFRDCVREGRHDGWVRRSNAAFMDSGYNATPTVLLNDEDIYGSAEEALTPERLKQQVEDLAAG